MASRTAFIGLVWPVVERWLGPGVQLVIGEGSGEAVAESLDMMNGIDFFFKQGRKMGGIASRVQFDRSYPTFTIRSRRQFTGALTELEKRLEQYADPDALLPAWTVQGYVSARKDGYVVECYMIKTRDLYWAAEHYGHKMEEREARVSGGRYASNARDRNLFKVAKVEMLQQHCEVLVYKHTMAWFCTRCKRYHDFILSWRCPYDDTVNCGMEFFINVKLQEKERR
jgi:hypothetical protein